MSIRIHTRRAFLGTALGGAAAAFSGCRQDPAPPPPSPPAGLPPVPAPPPWNLSELAPPPDWSVLDAWQDVVTREDFSRVLETILTDGTAAWRTVEVREDRALLLTSTARADAERYELRFAPAGQPGTPARTWRAPADIPGRTAERPLAGVRIALDPGHIGGVWAQMEERWFRIGEAPPVKEGELSLRVAEILRPQLEALGATVLMVRDALAPATPLRPENLLEEARQSLTRSGRPITDNALKRESERLFYRTAEIRARGVKVNGELKPDLVVCLHFNATGWGNASKPTLSPLNHLHVLAHGCLSTEEFNLDDQRLDGLLRLVQGVPGTEIPLCDAVAKSLAAATGLPAFTYPGNNARRVNDNPFLWARNLLANRVYHCPVVFTEPYVMNSEEVFARVQAGDYEGETEVAGRRCRSIFREYATGVAEGLATAFREA